MTETRLLDYAFQHPPMTAIQNSGAVGVLRYACPAGAPKRITPDEAKQIRAAGLWLGLVFESTATRATQGHAAGLADAQMAAQQACAIGYPNTAPLFFAVDQDTDWASVASYFQGVKDAKMPNPRGAYGSYDIVEGAAAAGVPYLWQTVAWSKGRTSGRAHLYQRNSSKQPVDGTDENVLMHPLPLWGAPTPAVPHAAPAYVPPANDSPSKHPWPLPAGDVIHVGNTHPAVDTVARYLKQPVDPNHVYTKFMATAVAHWQDRNGLSTTPAGMLNKATWQAMK
jgi:hypothetical protein